MSVLSPVLAVGRQKGGIIANSATGLTLKRAWGDCWLGQSLRRALHAQESIKARRREGSVDE